MQSKLLTYRLECGDLNHLTMHPGDRADEMLQTAIKRVYELFELTDNLARLTANARQQTINNPKFSNHMENIEDKILEFIMLENGIVSISIDFLNGSRRFLTVKVPIFRIKTPDTDEALGILKVLTDQMGNPDYSVDSLIELDWIGESADTAMDAYVNEGLQQISEALRLHEAGEAHADMIELEIRDPGRENLSDVTLHQDLMPKIYDLIRESIEA